MSWLKTALASLVFVSSVAAADDSDPVTMARNIGFTGCDVLINSTFENAKSANERRTNIRYFEGQAKKSVDIDMTYGSIGDTVIQTVHFAKEGGYCYASMTATITQPGNCAGLLNQDEHFRYTADAAGILWSKNAGGVTKLFTQTGNHCTQIFIRDQKVKI